MRLGKKKEKEKDAEPRSQNVEGISRLICSAKGSHNTPMKGIDIFALYSAFINYLCLLLPWNLISD